MVNNFNMDETDALYVDMETVNHWNNAQEAMAEDIQNRATQLSIYFEHRANQAAHWGNWLTIVSTGISLFTSVEALIGETVPDLMVTITTSLGGFMAAVLIVLNNIWACGVTQCEAREASAGFFPRSNTIKLQWSLNRNERQSGESFVREVTREMEYLRRCSPGGRYCHEAPSQA